MEGLIMAARFSLGCNEAVLFPEREAILYNFLANPSKKGLAEKAKATLKQFSILFPYLSLIAGKTGLDPFSFKVVEAYFIGNKLLEKVPKEEMERMLSQIYDRPITLDDDVFPHHNFHLLGVVPKVESNPILPLLNLCMVRMGEVKRVEPDQVIIKVWTIESSKNGFRLGHRREVIEGRSVFVKELKPKDKVAVHWQHICEKLEPDQVNSLEKYTRKALKMLK